MASKRIRGIGLAVAGVVFAAMLSSLTVAHAEVTPMAKGCNVGSSGISAWASGNCTHRGGRFHVVATCHQRTGGGQRTVTKSGISVPNGGTSSVSCRGGRYTSVHVAAG